MKAPKQVTAYRCPDCDQWCGDRWDAMEHCEDFIVSGEAWDCGGSCDDGLHDAEKQAKTCMAGTPDCTDCGHPERWHHLLANRADTFCHEGNCGCREYVFALVLA